MSAFDATTLQELETLLGRERNTLLNMFEKDSTRLLQLMREALSGEDRDQLRLTAHSLKGASINLGAMDVNQCCVRIEHIATSATIADLKILVEELARSHAQAIAELDEHKIEPEQKSD